LQENVMKVLWLGFPLLLLLTSCGSSGGGASTGSVGGSPLPVIAGKWTISSTSTQGHLNSTLFVDLTDQGNGSFNASQVVLCYHNPNLICYGGFAGNGSIAIQGTVAEQGNFTMVVTSSPQGATGCSATYTGTVASSSMSANYTGCQDGGTMTAITNPTLTGTYTGQLTSGANPGLFPFGISASITEASDHSLTGTASITSSPCFTALTFEPPSMAVGGSVYLKDQTHGITVVTPLESPYNPQAISVVYSVLPTQFCTGDYGTGTLTKH
jgi:hypothetical protein